MPVSHILCTLYAYAATLMRTMYAVKKKIVSKRSARARPRLSRERVLRAAMDHADRGGIETLTMRKLAEVLGVAPMALYRHVANKDDLIDAMVDLAFGEIGLPPSSADWRTAMRQRAM